MITFGLYQVRKLPLQIVSEFTGHDSIQLEKTSFQDLIRSGNILFIDKSLRDIIGCFIVYN